MTFFSHRKLQENEYTAKMATAARRQITGGGGGALINKSRLWSPQIVGGGAARPAHSSNSSLVGGIGIAPSRIARIKDAVNGSSTGHNL